MRKLRVLLAAPAVAGLVTIGAPTVQADKVAAAQPKGDTTCKVDVKAEFIPGLTLDPGRTSYYVSAVGPLNCDGPIDGEMPTGPGDYASAGRMGTLDPDSCQSGGEGWGSNRMVVPTKSGDKVLRSAFTFTYGGTQGKFFTGDWDGDYTSGTLALKSVTKGDCVTSPLQEGVFELVFKIHEFRGPTK